MSIHTDRLPLVTMDTTPDDIVFWDTDDGTEQLSHGELEEAVEYALDCIHPGPYPEEIEVFGWRRRVVGENALSASSWTENILEWLDEEYGDPDAGFEPTKRMKEAAEKCMAVFREEYTAWQCETACRIMVKTAPYFETPKEQ